MKVAILIAAVAGTLFCLRGSLPFGSSGGPTDLQTLWYPSGQLQVRAQLSDGVRNGPASEWYPNGQERCSGEYRDGLREGTWVFRLPDGSIDARQSGEYAAGERIGD